MLQLMIFGGIGLLAMVSEVLGFSRIMSLLFRVGTLVCIASLFVNYGLDITWFGNMMVEDRFSQAFILTTCLMLATWTFGFGRKIGEDEYRNDYIALFSFSMVGGVMMLSYTNLVMLFLGLEILSIPLYVLVGSSKRNLKSNESAFKYFLMGAFASGIMLFGIAFLYGAAGTFDLHQMALQANTGGSFPVFFHMGMVLLIFAFAFKMAVVPFHFWAPDVYEGAPNAMTVYMAALVKTFAIASAFRFFYIVFGGEAGIYSSLLVGMSAVSMLLGNIIGAVQDNPKRLLAYSGVGHAGFMLMAVIVNGEIGANALLYYSVVYSLSLFLAFFVLDKVLIHDDFYWSIGDFKGLAKRNPWLAMSMAVALLSMAGIPPLGGFYAKLFMLKAAFTNGHYVLIWTGLIGSLIAMYYYLKFIINMYSRNPDSDVDSKLTLNYWDKLVMGFIGSTLLILGLFPDLVSALIRF